LAPSEVFGAQSAARDRLAYDTLRWPSGVKLPNSPLILATFFPGIYPTRHMNVRLMKNTRSSGFEMLKGR